VNIYLQSATTLSYWAEVRLGLVSINTFVSIDFDYDWPKDPQILFKENVF